MINKPKIIFVTGSPATGKTTIARTIGEKFNIPVICKDDIKESLFESLGWSDREWSRKLGTATYQIMYRVLSEQLAAKKSMVLEADFRPKLDEPKIIELKNKYEFETLVIHCHADAKIVQERVKSRVDSGTRHPGHVDQENYKNYTAEILARDFAMLKIGGQEIELDTSDYSKVDFEKLWKEVRNYLEK